jgi:vacuolar protein sorting-associated protein 13D
VAKQSHSKTYDKYAMDFNNMQIIVGQVKDNRKGADLTGNPSLHVVDRFSISLQIERRTVENTDPPAWPSIIISVTLPRLQLHEENHTSQGGEARLWRQE